MHTLTLKRAQRLTGQLQQYAYNAMDCVGTRQVFDTLYPMLRDDQLRYYAFCRAAQLPAFQMGLRGILVDPEALAEATSEVQKELRRLKGQIDRLPAVRKHWDGREKDTGLCMKSTRKDSRHTWPRGVPDDDPDKRCTSCGAPRMKRSPFNANSAVQRAHLFYDILGMPPLKNKTGNVSTDKDVIIRLLDKHPEHRELLEAVRDFTGLKKQLGFLKSRLSPEGRFPSSFTVGTAWTGRWSSTKNVYGEGGNAQNIAPRHRNIFIADPGKVLVYADLKQAESNLVAHIAGDQRYIDAHNSGDVHTFVTKFIWPDYDWTGNIDHDKKIAKGNNPPWDPAPGHNIRFQSKRFQHGGNYGLTAFGVSRIHHIPVAGARTALRNYHNEFPGIRAWHRWTSAIVRAGERLRMPLGFEVALLGRPWDDHTVKQGLALLPQGTVAHLINLGAWGIWKTMDPEEAELLAQIHDALLFQVPEGRLDLVKKAADIMRVPLRVTDINGKERVTTLDVEVAVGKNWGKKSADNPHGLEEIEV